MTVSLLVLSVLSVFFSYTSAQTPSSVALCVIAKDDNDDFLEWVIHHKGIGISNIYLIDNNSSVPLIQAPGIRSHVVSGFIAQYSYFSTQKVPNNQLWAYRYCLENFKDKHDFIGFIDTDEYIVVRDQNQTVSQIFDSFRDMGGLSLHWLMFGSNGHVERPEGGVVRNYDTKCQQAITVKTFVNTRYVADDPLLGHPYNFKFKDGYNSVDTNKRTVLSSRNEKDGKPPPGVFDVIYLNHYVLKSFEDYKKKSARGSGDGTRKPIEFFDVRERIIEKLQPQAICDVLRSRL